MRKLAISLALAASCVLPMATPAIALETYEARVEATDAAYQARSDAIETFGSIDLQPGKYVWRDVSGATGAERVVVSLGEQRAYLYRGNTLIAMSTISSGKPGHDTPSGIFSIHTKKTLHLSKKYDNAPMPFAQFFDEYGVALHAGNIPGRPASHGCVRLPSSFAKKLFAVTEQGTQVYIGA